MTPATFVRRSSRVRFISVISFGMNSFHLQINSIISRTSTQVFFIQNAFMHMFSLFKEMIAKNVEVCYTDGKLFLFQKEALEKRRSAP